MVYRRLGKTDLDVSIIALGCWAMGNDPGFWGVVNDNESIAAIHQALDVGINLIDTAPSYGYGHSEEIVGKAVADRRDKVVLATKCGIVWPREGKKTLRRKLTAASIKRECEASLRRLRTDVIDVYQCHWPDPETPLEETMETMLGLKEQGKIRAIGVSNFSCQEMSACRSVGALDCLQPQLSLLERRATQDLIPYCQEYGIGVLVYSPLCKGMLTGKYAPETRPKDFRAKDEHFESDRMGRNLQILDRLRPLADRYGITLGQLAITWAANTPGVTAAIVGAKKPSQVAENAGAADVRLTIQDTVGIDEILRGV